MCKGDCLLFLRMTKTIWAEVYNRIAQKLIERFPHDNTAGDELYDLLINDRAFGNVNRNWAIRLSNSEYRTGSIDPIALFASFNNFGIREETRLERINYLLGVLDPGSDLFQPGKIDFRGCPTPIGIKILAIRPIDQQIEIWRLFRIILTQGKNGLVFHYFDFYKDWAGIQLASFTIFLFWVNYKNFLPLDKNTVSLLIARQITDGTPESFEEYQRLLNDPRIPDYLKFSIDAFESRNASPLQETNTRPLQETSTTGSPSKNFRLLGLSVSGETSICHRKVLEPGHVYSFYQAFDFGNLEKIQYDPQKDIQFYNTGQNTEVSISAVVGPNGFGKSTLTELLCMAINNIAVQYNGSEKLEPVKETLKVDLYYNAEHLYRISVYDTDIKMYRYHFDKDTSTFRTPQQYEFSKFPFENFFYSLYINYSLYALNENHFGEWLQSLFHKKDSYQIPIALSPHREEGIININKENELVNARLLAFILSMPIMEDGLFLLLKLTETNAASSIALTYDPKKVEKLYWHLQLINKTPLRIQKAIEKTKTYWLLFINSVCKVFDFEPPTIDTDPFKDSTLVHTAFKYALNKAIRISLCYKEYVGQYNLPKNSFKDLEHYVGLLKNDPSHIAYKFKQAIYFIKYTYLRKHTEDEEGNPKAPHPISITRLSEDIYDMMVRENDFKTIHFIPPSFFKCTITLQNGIPFADTSSGEKQKIYAISSLLYHLNNLDSKIKSEKAIAYRYVHIFFDEVELYFHPEMQRTFINTLLSYLKHAPFERLMGINITFITHSPFILSDIPNENILSMEKDNPIGKSFGANIHDLLANNFFHKNSVMGEFAKRLILDLSTYLTAENKETVVQEEWTKESAKQAIDLVGEPLLRERLLKMYDKKFGEDQFKDQRIAFLESELNKLRPK